MFIYNFNIKSCASLYYHFSQSSVLQSGQLGLLFPRRESVAKVYTHRSKQERWNSCPHLRTLSASLSKSAFHKRMRKSDAQSNIMMKQLQRLTLLRIALRRSYTPHCTFVPFQSLPIDHSGQDIDVTNQKLHDSPAFSSFLILNMLLLLTAWFE